MYLVKRGKKAGKRWVAHIWYGDYPKSLDGDTACRMASTGGLNQRRYLITPTPLHIAQNGKKTPLPVCSMCATNDEKTRPRQASVRLSADDCAVVNRECKYGQSGLF